MAQKNKSKSGMLSVNALIAENKKARYSYEILETFEAGIILLGSEVKSLRLGQASIAEGYIAPKDGKILAHNLTIAEYTQAGKHYQHDPGRIKELLLHKREIHKLMGSVNKEGLTIVPLKLYFDAHGRAKLLIGLAKGKKLHDKRETQKNRDWNRDKSRIMKERS